jgi:hypothetical protein
VLGASFLFLCLRIFLFLSASFALLCLALHRSLLPCLVLSLVFVLSVRPAKSFHRCWCFFLWLMPFVFVCRMSCFTIMSCLVLSCLVVVLSCLVVVLSCLVLWLYLSYLALMLVLFCEKTNMIVTSLHLFCHPLQNHLMQKQMPP